MRARRPFAPVPLCVALALVACDDGAGSSADVGATAPDAVVDAMGHEGTVDASADDSVDVSADDSVDASVDASMPSDAIPRDARPDVPDAEPPDAAPPPVDPPARVLFIGNSFTFGGPVPTIVDRLANDAGWPDPHVVYSAFGGESLQGHRTNRPQTLERVDEGDWDVVVLQELSTRPTDNAGAPERFKEDATWFFERIQASSPGARVILYETWARHPDHGIYPRTFADPAEMQAQLRFHYTDAAERHIPAHAAAPVEPPVVVAPAGDAWEAHLAEPGALRLHGDDDYHAAPTGQYLNGLVIYSTIYDRAVAGRTPWNVAPADAARLQDTVDRLTGRRVQGGPDGRPGVLGLRPGQRVQLDLGDDDIGDDWPNDWNAITDAVDGIAPRLRSAEGEASSVAVSVTRAFGGVNRQGLAENDLGWPGGATVDSFFCGSFDDHADGLTRPGRLRVDGLDPRGVYRLTLFAARAGDDGGRGRLTRYIVGDRWVELDASDNRARTARIDFGPDALGGAELTVAVSPDGDGRFCYLGALVVERLE